MPDRHSISQPVSASSFRWRVGFGGENDIGQRGIILGAKLLNKIVDVIGRCPKPPQDGAAQLQAHFERLVNNTGRTGFL